MDATPSRRPQPHGLAALHGSSPDVGVAGYTLGGGIGWYARKLGLADQQRDRDRARHRRRRPASGPTTQRPELFWALRGGGGNFGVVTALEFRPLPDPDARTPAC